MSDITEALQILNYNGLTDFQIETVIKELLGGGNIVDADDIRALILMQDHIYNGNKFDLAVQSDYDDCAFKIGGAEYLVLNEEERYERWERSLESYLDECVENSDSPYFDRDRWIQDAKIDGAGIYLATYDHSEIEKYVDTYDWYYIYRTS